MIQGSLRLKVSTNPGYIADRVFRSGVQEIFEDELLNCAAELERESPEGYFMVDNSGFKSLDWT